MCRRQAKQGRTVVLLVVKTWHVHRCVCSSLWNAESGKSAVSGKSLRCHLRCVSCWCTCCLCCCFNMAANNVDTQEHRSLWDVIAVISKCTGLSRTVWVRLNSDSGENSGIILSVFYLFICLTIRRHWKNKNISIDWWNFEKLTLYAIMYTRTEITVTSQTGIALKRWVLFDKILMDFCSRVRSNLKK